MQLVLKNGKTLSIPESEGRARPQWSSETPYIEKFLNRARSKNFLPKTLSVKLECLSNLKEAIGGYSSYFEPLAGIGITAKLLEAYPTWTYLNEMDEECRKVLEVNFQGAAISGTDSISNPEFGIAPDVTFLDFNNYTMRKWTDSIGLLEYAFRATKQAVIVNDCSVFHLRYGKKSFENYSRFLGVPVENHLEFFYAAKMWYAKRLEGWFLTNVEYNIETAFLLFKREDSGLRVNRVSPESVDAQVWARP